MIGAMIPFFSRCHVKWALAGSGLLELANAMAVWSWNIQPDPFPATSSIFGFFATSLVYLVVSLTVVLSVTRFGSRSLLIREGLEARA